MSKRTTIRTDEPRMAAHVDPTTPTTRDLALLNAYGVNTENGVQPHTLRDVRASMARPKPPKTRIERRHGHDVVVRVTR